MFKQLRILQIIDVVVGLDVEQIEERENHIGGSEKTRSVTVVVVWWHWLFWWFGCGVSTIGLSLSLSPLAPLSLDLVFYACNSFGFHCF